MRTRIMGVVNITPDSFFDGGKFLELEKAVEHSKLLVTQGASILDIGGESSRPGSEPVSVEEELKRVIPVIQRLAVEVSIPLSIDTTKPAVAEAAISAGAAMINDIGGFRDQEMIDAAARSGAMVCIMHMQGKPKTMQEKPQYEDVVQEVYDFLADRVRACEAVGIKEIWIDPGIGFGKTLEHNLLLLKNLERFKELGKPILLGTSRKSFIEKSTGAPVEERLPGTIASNIWGILHGADIVRVHDVAEVKQAIQIIEAIESV